MTVAQTCRVPVFQGSFAGHAPCGKPAKVERDGMHFCRIHDPAKREAKMARCEMLVKLRNAETAIETAEVDALAEFMAWKPNHAATKRVLAARQKAEELRSQLASLTPTRAKPEDKR